MSSCKRNINCSRAVRLAERVASTLKLGDELRAVKLKQPISSKARPTSSWGSLGAAWSDSQLVDIRYSDPDPQRAQRIANAYADAFIALNIDKRFQANENAKVFLEDKIQQLKLRLEESERTMLEFAQKQQIVATDIAEKSSIAETTLAEATTELSTLISERTKNEGLWRQAESSDALSLPQLLSDPCHRRLAQQAL